MKIKSIFVENFKILKNFKIDFCNDNQINPVTILSGINGSGKTTVFEFITEMFKSENSILKRINKNSFIEVESQSLEKLIIKNYKDFNASDNSEKIIYYKAGEENISAKKIIIDYIDELIYEKDIKSSDAYEQMRNALNNILSTLNLQIEFSKLDKQKEIYFRNNQSEEIKLKDLSGGEKEIITKIFPLYISQIKNSVILIDEPESSMHPNWQIEIIDLYKKIAELNNNQIIIATHSPHIVSAIENKYIKILIKEDGLIKVIDNYS